ncbi:AAA family ATPase [Schnuerera sp.]|uniref:AAA family ATPase n=1 Tax=Schnuerera sp. TaxID=2794844 RepID=UPI002B6A8BBB|nr:AAA family ATPase [Schnuerera sp.]HSH35239.1 AAA family ATPase [Schnuerera sp.]
MTNLTEIYANNNNPNIIGRDREMQMLFLTMMRHEKPNALLTGQAGVGKTALVHNLAFLIANQLAPEPLHGFKVLEINTNKLLSGPGYRGVTEEKFQNLIEHSLDSGKVILFMDEFHTVESLGQMSNGQTPGLGNTLKPYLTRPDFRVIGATTSNEFSKMTDKALLRRFYQMNVTEPTDDAVSHIIKVCLKMYGKGLKAKSDVVETILRLSKTHSGFNPDVAKDITDFVCSYAKMTGNKLITSTFVEDFYNKFYKQVSQKDEELPELVMEE